MLSLPKPRESVLNARDQRLLLVPMLLMRHYAALWAAWSRTPAR